MSGNTASSAIWTKSLGYKEAASGTPNRVAQPPPTPRPTRRGDRCQGRRRGVPRLQRLAIHGVSGAVARGRDRHVRLPGQSIAMGRSTGKIRACVWRRGGSRRLRYPGMVDQARRRFWALSGLRERTLALRTQNRSAATRLSIHVCRRRPRSSNEIAVEISVDVPFWWLQQHQLISRR